MSVSFDTNILLYSADRRDQRKQSIAHNLLNNNRNGILLWQVACEFVGASKKLAESGLTGKEAWELLRIYLTTFRLAAPSQGILARAQTLHVDRRWSFWDALLVSAALEAGVTTLYSEDVPGSAPPGPLRIVNPFV